MFKKLLLKFLTLITITRYPRVPLIYRYFYRDTYYCQLIQWKYLLRDYVIKKPYKEIEHSGEFGQELLFVLPFAYWHHKNGTLKATVSAKLTQELYAFSPNHEQRFSVRTNKGNYNFEIPRVLYSQNYHIKKWEPVPLKAMYKNDRYVFEKPALIIANRYNMEWDGPPVSFFSIPLLDFMITRLKDHYTLIYNRPQSANITDDNSDIYDLKEHGWLAENHPEVIMLDDLYEADKALVQNFNHLQLMVYANAEHFISTHGGTGTLASYFGGTNILFSKQGGEHFFGCFHRLYPKLSGAKIIVARTDEEVRTAVEKTFLPSVSKPHSIP